MWRLASYASCALALVLIGGCASPYAPHGLTGGYVDTRLNESTFRVSFWGNAFTSPTRTQDLAILRAAELTLKNGFSHFVVLDGDTRVDWQSFTVPGQINTQTTINRTGPVTQIQQQTQVSPPQWVSTSKPNSFLLIQAFRGAPATSALVYDARLVFDSLSGQYGSGR